MEPEIDHGVVVYDVDTKEEYVIEGSPVNETHGITMVLYRASRGNWLFVRTVEDFKRQFYMEDYDE